MRRIIIFYLYVRMGSYTIKMQSFSTKGQKEKKKKVKN